MLLMKGTISAKRDYQKKKKQVLLLEHFAKYFSILASSIVDTD